MRVNSSAVDFIRTRGDLFRKLYHRIRGFEIDDHALRCGNIELDHVRGLHVRKGAVHRQKFREIGELCKPRPRPVSLSARRKLHARERFAEVCRPTVEEGYTQIFQYGRLQVGLHGVHLRHTVGDRRTRRKHNAPVAAV